MLTFRWVNLQGLPFHINIMSKTPQKGGNQGLTYLSAVGCPVLGSSAFLAPKHSSDMSVPDFGLLSSLSDPDSNLEI